MISKPGCIQLDWHRASHLPQYSIPQPARGPAIGVSRNRIFQEASMPINATAITSAARSVAKIDVFPFATAMDFRVFPIVPQVAVEPVDVFPDVNYLHQWISGTISGQGFGFAFPSGGTKLNARQRQFLVGAVIPFLKGDAVCEIYTVADRTGSQETNYRVTKDRLVNFQRDLSMGGAPARLVYNPKHKYFGEDIAESSKDEDKTSNALSRRAIIFTWPNYQSSQRALTRIKIIKYGRSHSQP